MIRSVLGDDTERSKPGRLAKELGRLAVLDDPVDTLLCDLGKGRFGGPFADLSVRICPWAVEVLTGEELESL